MNSRPISPSDKHCCQVEPEGRDRKGSYTLLPVRYGEDHIRTNVQLHAGWPLFTRTVEHVTRGIW